MIVPRITVTIEIEDQRRWVESKTIDPDRWDASYPYQINKHEILSEVAEDAIAEILNREEDAKL